MIRISASVRKQTDFFDNNIIALSLRNTPTEYRSQQQHSNNMMDHRALSPAETNEEDMDDGSPPSSPAEDFEQRVKPKKIRANKSLIVKEGKKKKRKVSDIPDSV